MSILKTTSKMLMMVPVLLVGACATVTEGNEEVVRVITQPASQNAHCLLENENGSWVINNTPAYVSIVKASDNLHISCTSTMGWTGEINVPSKVAPKTVITNIAGGAAVALATLGQPIGLGAAAGVAAGGTAYDAESGALYEYAPTIILELTQKNMWNH